LAVPNQQFLRTGDQMETRPRIVPLSESALTIEFGETIDPHTNESVLAFATAVERAGLPGILEVVPTYRSVTVYFDPFRTDVATMTGHFRALMTATNTPPLRAPTTHNHSRVVWR
jgi:allophanate hydrolase subunit 1